MSFTSTHYSLLKFLSKQVLFFSYLSIFLYKYPSTYIYLTPLNAFFPSPPMFSLLSMWLLLVISFRVSIFPCCFCSPCLCNIFAQQLPVPPVANGKIRVMLKSCGISFIPLQEQSNFPTWFSAWPHKPWHPQSWGVGIAMQRLGLCDCQYDLAAGSFSLHKPHLSESASLAHGRRHCRLFCCF